MDFGEERRGDDRRKEGRKERKNVRGIQYDWQSGMFCYRREIGADTRDFENCCVDWKKNILFFFACWFVLF